MQWNYHWHYEESSQCLAATLVQRYRAGSHCEWPLLFQRTLKNCVLDWPRQPARLRHWFWPLMGQMIEEQGLSVAIDAEYAESYSMLLPVNADLEIVLRAIERLPSRQQEIFLLQAWEGMSETEIANVLHCSEGRVKTHYCRAMQTLRSAWQRRSRSRA
jgi:RNA polymerase sigma-70 factor (ECF subfamily)